MAVHGGNVDEISRKYGINKEEIIDFSANINPLGINKNVKKAMIEALDFVEKYPDITYYKLKTAIAEYEAIEKDNIVIGNGAAEVIFNVVRAIKPKKVLLPAPTFSEYEEAVLSIGSKIQYHILREESEFKITEDFVDSINESIDMIFICNPNNPTGALTKWTIVEKIVSKAKLHNAVVVIDESFLDFIKEDNEFNSKHLLDKYDNLIIIKSLTKFFAIPGIRVGYGMCKSYRVEELINKVSVPWSVNIVASEGVCQGLKEVEYIKDTIGYVEKERVYLENSLRKIEDIRVFSPSVNFIMIKVLNNINLKEKLLEKSILIRNCDTYVGLDKKYFRVAIRTREENMKLIESINSIFNL